MINNEDIDMLSHYFVTTDKCDDRVCEQNRQINSLSTNIVKIGTKLNIIVAILAAIGTAILSVAVKLLFV